MRLKDILNRIKKNEFVYTVGKSTLLKPVSMLISLAYTPILLNFLGEEQNGVWATILSVVNWISLGDIGIGNGLRNRITKEYAKEEFDEIKYTISTAYVVFLFIFSFIFLIGSVIGQFVNWNYVFNTNVAVKIPLLITFFFICLNFILGLYAYMYYALQKAEIPAFAAVLVQTLNLAIVALLFFFKISTQKLIWMACIFGFTKLFVSVLFTLRVKKYCAYMKPTLKFFKRTKLKEICNIGFRFFVIQIASMVLYTTDSLIISRLISPVSVTSYNVVTKFFIIPYSVFTAMLSPLWSKCTEAKEKGDYRWIKKYYNYYRIIWLVLSICVVIAVPIFKPFARIWLHRELVYDTGIVLSSAIYYIVLMYCGIISSILNGLGEINLSLIVSVFMMIINIPLSIFLASNCRLYTTGVSLGTVIPQTMAAVILGIQVKRLLKHSTDEITE